MKLDKGLIAGSSTLLVLSLLEKEDMYILGRMKEFASDEEVVTFAAAKQLLILIERAVRGSLLKSFRRP